MPNAPETWLNEFIVNWTESSFAGDPDIIQLANGNILVSWASDTIYNSGSPPGTDILGQIFDPLGNRIGGEFRINVSFSADDEYDVDMAALPGGGFMATYVDVQAGVASIRLDEFNASGAVVSSNPTVVSDVSTAAPNYSSPRAAASSDTSVLIAYEQDGDIVGKVYNPAANTYGAQIGLIAGVLDDLSRPDVTALANGNYLVTADIDYPGGSQIIYRIVDSAGGNILAATTIPLSGTDNTNASAAALAGGGFVIAYDELDPVDSDVRVRVFDSAGSVVAITAASDPAELTNANLSPVVAGLADGSFVVVCENAETERVDVTHFSAAGNWLGVFNFAGPDDLGANGLNAAVTDLGDGRFAVTWIDLSFDSIGVNTVMEILDTRDFVNSPGVYTPDVWQTGTVGDDVFTASTGAGIVHGWDGHDTITESAQPGLSSIFGDDGDDTIIVMSLLDSTDAWDGGEGIDMIDWSLGNELTMTFDLLLGAARNLFGDVEQMLNFENLVGTRWDDTIIGSAGANTLQGGDGGDTIDGGAGEDDLRGDSGTDTLTGGTEIDVLDGGTGADIMRGGTGTELLPGRQHRR